MSVNKVILIGNLTRKPELKSLPSGNQLTNLSIATNDRRKVGDEWENVAEYHDIVVFGRQAESCVTYLDKGRQAYVEGRLQTRKYTGKDGVERRKTEIVASKVQFLGGKQERKQESSSYDAMNEVPF
jgi:single-strand DNA-binding protein